MSDRKINIAIVGLGFGAEFIPIYQKHPNANMYAICQRSPEKLEAMGLTTVISTPDQVGAMVKSEMALYLKVVRAANIRIE